MALRYSPSGADPYDIQLWRALRTSNVVFWFQDMATGRPLHMVKWGPELYLPVTEGLRFGLVAYNATGDYIGMPIYIEGLNLWVGGPDRPNACDGDSMWELSGYQKHVMDALVDPHSTEARPLEVVAAHQGFGIGEATFGAAAADLRGLIQVYKRTCSGFDVWDEPVVRRPVRGDDIPVGTFGDELFRGPVERGGPESYGKGFTPKGFTPPPEPRVETEHQVAIGAAETVHRRHSDTGRRYFQDATLIAAVHVEHRRDLASLLARAHQPTDRWGWIPEAPDWWTSFQGLTRLANQIPVPHRGSTGNWGTRPVR